MIREEKGEQAEENPWGIKFLQCLFNMTSASHLFHTRQELEADGWELRGNIFVRPNDDTRQYLPLYEGKMVHQFNHRWATFVDIDEVRDTNLEERQNREFSVLPRYWVCEIEVWRKLEDAKWQHGWLMGWRDVTNATNERTVVGGVFPLGCVGHTLPLWMSLFRQYFYLPAILNSIVCDFFARLKVGGLHLTYFIAKQLPIISSGFLICPFMKQPDLTVADWLKPRILELTYTAEDLRPFAEDMGYDGEPFVWDDERRFQLRAELDAAFFHLYLPANADGTWIRAEKETDAEYKSLCAAFPTPRHAVSYIMETFTKVKKKDVAAYGHYRTK